jgi:polyisoprenyl-phosphate glycosyltransferase
MSGPDASGARSSAGAEMERVNRASVAERDVLLELAGRAGPQSEVARSLAVGAVVRGRLAPELAAQLSSYTRAELELVAPLSSAREPPTTPLVSVVVPAYDEEENLGSLWDRLAPVLDAVGSGELILVDDGSHDATWSEIRRLAASDPRVRGLRLSRNFGHQAALSAGMAHARGKAVCFMDADLQDPPEMLHELMARWREGNEVVYAVRRSRKEGLAKRVAYRGFYRVYRRLANIDVAVDSGDFALLDRQVVDRLLALPEHNRFLRGLRSWVGYRQVGVEYDRDARHAGEPKYTLRGLVRLAVDGILSFSAAPLRMASLLGVLVAMAGGIYIAVAIAYRLVDGNVPEGWTSLIAIVLTVGGMQLVVVGVLGEYVARIYDETKGRPHFLVAEETTVSAREP